MIDRGPVQKMLERYQCRNNDQRRDALKEIVQEIALVGLWRGGFFTHAAFLGGTALRIFHELDRFSEDLDFSLTKPDQAFDLDVYLPALRDELGAFGFDMAVTRRAKSTDSAIQSAFIKGGTLLHLITIASINPPVPGVHAGEQLKIKLEVDTDPPDGAGFEARFRQSPIPYSVRLYDQPSNFAGKIHALLCRGWKQRVKGRDFYDYVWFLSRGVPVNLPHLESRMRQTGHWTGLASIDRDTLLGLLFDRFQAVDFAQVRADVRPFIGDSRSLDLWGPEFFMAITSDNLKVPQGV